MPAFDFPRLYVICDDDVCARAGWSVPDYAAACLEAGARFLQVRAKHASSGALLDMVDAVVERARGTGALILVNDRADVAKLAGAAGVHVGQDDLAPVAVRDILGAEACIGLSTHTHPQLAVAVRQPIDYVAIGPVFGTTTKATGYDAVGVSRVVDAVAASGGRIPVVAIGGITLETAPAVIGAGASSVAVIADLLRTNDPRARVREYLDRL